MNKIKKPLLILLVLALFTACILTLVGCGGTTEGDGLSAISVSVKSAHKKIYVQGQELNLDGGLLTTIVDGKEASLPFTADGITVTGYDPNTLGKQTLTVSYMGKTTTFEVEVVARAVAEGYEKDYFVGEKFDPLKGKIKITKDNGSTVNVTLSSRSVTLKTPFDSTTAGTKTVTVTYTEEGGATYDCSFNVTVHNIASVTPNFPYKTEYKSHEDIFDTAGGWLTVKAEAPSTLTKSVQISSGMISGFDPSLATSANIETPLEQTVKITYGNNVFDFKITILYSGVYVINDAAEVLKSIDWSAENPIIDNNQATIAIDAMKAYFKLEDSEKSLIDEEKLNTVLKPATVALYGKYLEESVGFADAFMVSTDGSISLVAKTREGVETAIARLEDDSDVFNTYASLASKIRNEFKDFELANGVTVKKYLLTHSPEDVSQLVTLFKYMLNISDKLKNVPDEWTIDDLKVHGEDIVNAANTAITSNYRGVSYAQLYFAVSSWRKSDDFLDIIYSYYYYVKEEGQKFIQENLWGKLPAPGMLADWYSAFVSALQEEQILEYYGSQAYLYDTSSFMYYYSQVLELSAKVLEEGDELSRNLYELLDCDAAINAYLRSAKYGYIYNMGEALDYDKVTGVWNTYVALLDKVFTTYDGSMVPFGEDIEALTKELLSLSPAELNAFISSMNFRYKSSGGTINVFDYQSKPWSKLIEIMAIYYTEVLPESLTPLFQRVLLAAESISQLGIKKSAFDDFKTYMGELNDLFENLSDTDKGTFKTHFEGVYSKYVALYNNVTDNAKIDLGGMENEFNELIGWLDTLDEIFYAISTAEDSATLNKLVPLAIAIYEKSNTLFEAIRQGKNQTAVNALFTKLYTKDEIDYTIDMRFFGARSAIVSILISSGVSDAAGNSIMSWDAYSGAGANTKEFIASIVDFLLSQYEGKLYTGDIYEIVKTFRAMTPADQAAFYLLGINVIYYEAIETNVAAMLTDGNKVDGLINKILNLEIASIMYKNASSEESLKALKGLASEIEAMLEALPDKENRDTYLAPLYAEYLEYVNSL